MKIVQDNFDIIKRNKNIRTGNEREEDKVYGYVDKDRRTIK